MKHVWVIILLILVGCQGDVPPVPELRFVFQPPDSTMFAVELTSRQIRDQGGTLSTDSSWNMTAHVLTKVDSGYALEGRTVSSHVFRNGNLVTDPILDLFSQGAMVYMLDSAGLATAVIGYEEIFVRLDSLLGPERSARVRAQVDPEVLAEQEIHRWNLRFRPHTGREIVLNQWQPDTATYVFPTGEVALYYSLARVIDTVRRDGQLCGVVQTVTHTDTAGLATLAALPLSEFEDGWLTQGKRRIEASDQGISLQISFWTVELETMLTHSEQVYQELFYPLATDAGEPIQNHLVETKDKKFKY